MTTYLSNESNILTFTSLLFVIPSVLAFTVNSVLFWPFFSLTNVSAAYHYSKWRPLLFIDWPLCYIITWLLFWESWRLEKLVVFACACSSVFFLFWIGWAFDRFVFSANATEKILCHALMHLIVNVGASLLCL